jgi:hypothetical protein
MAQKPNAVLEEIDKKRKQERRARALRAMREVLSSDQGREAVWYLATTTGFFAPQIWDPSSAIHANAALRDYGREMILFLMEANESAIFDQQRLEWHKLASERVEDEKILKGKED